MIGKTVLEQIKQNIKESIDTIQTADKLRDFLLAHGKWLKVNKDHPLLEEVRDNGQPST